LSNPEAARQLLENPLFIEAFDTVREGVIAHIEELPLVESEERNQAGLQLVALAGVKASIIDYINTGKLDAEDDNKESAG
jgi:hypothetical protein